ncbi:hypothetical protein PSM54_21505, partial [Clostridioides difficile]
DIGQFSCYFVNEKIARVMVNPFGEVDLTPSIAAIHDNEKQAAKFTETNDCYELHFADKEIIVCKNPFQIIMKQAG